MKKQIFALSVLCSVPSICVADTILGLYAGVGQWQTNLSGDVGEQGQTTSLDDLGHDKEPANQIWLHFEHPIPILPNIRLMSTQINSEATTSQSQEFRLGGTTVTVTDDILTEIDLTHIDATLYYEILDNWVSLDAGITARQLSGFTEARSTTTGYTVAKGDLEGVIPLLYLRAQFDLPFTGWHVAAHTNSIGYDGNSVTEVSGQIGYEMDFVAVDVGINIGYRSMAIKAKNIDNLYADAEAKGVFGEIQLHF